MDLRLVGRSLERDQLTASLDQARSGKGSLVLIGGEAGVGKSALARTVLAGSGLAVVEGEGIQEGTPPYGPLVSVLRRLLSGRQALLEDARARSQLAVILPDLGSPAPAGDRSSLLDEIRAILARAASDRPLALLLDDLQWADEATLGALPALSRSLETEGVVILAVYRSDDIPRGHPLRRMRADLRRAGRLTEVLLEPLDVEATGDLLALTLGHAPSPHLTATIFERTDGVPFFVEELSCALAASQRLVAGPSGLELLEDQQLPIPDSVRDAVRLRLTGISDDGWTALTAAAVAGLTFDPHLVTEVAGLDEWPEELTAGGVVIRARSDRLAFRHALIREALYEEVPWSRRVVLHRAVAERLGLSEASPEVVAEHWARGREADRARSCFIEAARTFRTVYAYRDAARASRRALDLWPDEHDALSRLDVLEHLAECAELAGDLAEAVTTWREVEEGRRQGDDARRLAEARSRLAAALELQGRWEEALACREAAASAFRSASCPGEAAAEGLAAAAHHRSAASFRAALDLLQSARTDATVAGRIDLEARILGLEGNVRARMGEGPEALRVVRSALALALEHRLTGAAAEVYQRLADSLEHTGDYRASAQTYDAAFGFCSANGLDPTAQLCLACLSVVVRQTGDWNRAGSLCRQVISSSAATVHARAVATGTLGLILALRGQARRARPLLIESASLAGTIELAAMELLAGWGLAVLHQVQGDRERAAERCRAIAERWRRTEERHYAISPLRWAATVFAEGGDETGLRECVAALDRISRETTQAEAQSALSHALGETALLEGDALEATARFGRALELLRGFGAPVERIESSRRNAAALALAGRQDDAVDHLSSAYRIARRMGAGPLAEQLATAIAQLPEQADRRPGRIRRKEAPAGGLTRREVEVIRLVAVGKTNREIGGELFISPRTVDMHVENILRKLDSPSRADAARRATELGLLPQPEIRVIGKASG